MLIRDWLLSGHRNIAATGGSRGAELSILYKKPETVLNKFITRVYAGSRSWH